MSLLNLKRKNNGGQPTWRTPLAELADMDRLFHMDEWFQRDWVPACNVKDSKDAFEIELAAPGLEKEDFKIEVLEGVLTISSEKEEKHEETKDDYTRKEFSSFAFSRSFSLPKNVNEEDIQAKYKNGVLSVTVKKKQKAEKKEAKTVSIS